MRSLFVFLALIVGITQCAWSQSMPGGCIFPTMGKSVTNILNNTNDPHNDGWKTSGNEFGNYCSGCVSYPGYHPGEDWNQVCNIPDDGLCDEGVAVYAIADGKVILRDDDVGGVEGGVIIEHDLPQAIDVSQFIYPGTVFPSAYSPLRNKIRSGYLHLKGIVVSSGADIKKGDKIGEITNPGGGPHLHLEIQWRTDILGFPPYATLSDGRQGLTNRGLLDPTNFLNAQIANNAPATYTYTNNGYTAYGPVVGGSATNWEYSASPQSDTFNLGETAYAVMKVENVKARHRYRATAFHNNGSWVQQWTFDTAYNEASPTSPWEKSFFFPGMVNLNKIGQWRLDAFIDVGSGFVPLDSFTIMVNQLADFVYDGNGYLCTGPMRDRGNWNYSGTKQKTSFVKGDTAYAVVRIDNITANHYFHVEAYNNGVKKWEWNSDWNIVAGTWDKAYFFPEWYNLPAGTCQLRLYVNFGQGNVWIDSKSFNVSTSSTPYYTNYSTDMAGNATSYMCKSVSGGASTDWVYTGSGKTTTFKKTDVPTALCMITDIKRNHQWSVEAQWRSSSLLPWQFKWDHFPAVNQVATTAPWKWSFFWPTWTNPPVGQCRMIVRLDIGGVMYTIKTLNFTVTN